MEQTLKNGEIFSFEKPISLEQIGFDIFKDTFLHLLNKHEIPIELIGAYIGKLPRPIVENHYAHKKNAPYFEEIVTFMTSKPSALLKFKITCPTVDDNLFNLIKEKVIGPTDPKEALPFTMRYMFGTDIMRNGLHFPTSLDDAIMEYPNLLEAVPYLREIPIIKAA